MKYKVSKISLSPARTINLGNFNSVKLSGSIEIVFDEPIGLKDKKLKQATNEARKWIRNELAAQFRPYRKLLKKQKGGDNKNG